MKDSFVLYNSFYAPIKTLKNEQLGKLLRAIFDYTINGTITQDNEILVAFMFIKNQIDIDSEKWENEKVKRSEAGKKGMASRWNNKNNSVITNDNSVINDITKITDNVNENVNVNVNVNENENVNNNIKYIIDFLNTKTNKHFRYTENNKKKIRARLNEGFTVKDFETVINKKCIDWLNDKQMNCYLRPETLFGSKFESYLQQKEKEITTKDIAEYIDFSDFED